MSKKKAITSVLAALLLTGSFSVLAAAGADDPLVSLSYVTSTYRAQLLEQAGAAAQAALENVYKGYLSGARGGVRLATYAKDASLELFTGMSLTLISGKAKISIAKGAVVDVTTGEEVANGAALNVNHCYLAAEDTKAEVTATTQSVFSIDGRPWDGTAAIVFSDVPAGSWYYEDVYRSVRLGLINGTSATTYEPASNLTVAQAIKMAACMHQLHNEGAVTLQNGTVNWYDSYVDYAVKAGIIKANEYTALNSAISRTDFVRVFYKALPEESYREINRVADGAIPDVSLTDPAASEIYTFYRAGILTGDENHRFNPKTAIVRSEVAAILSRMMDESTRKSVTLP